jgi:hypothetical protein
MRYLGGNVVCRARGLQRSREASVDHRPRNKEDGERGGVVCNAMSVIDLPLLPTPPPATAAAATLSLPHSVCVYPMRLFSFCIHMYMFRMCIGSVHLAVATLLDLITVPQPPLLA